MIKVSGADAHIEVEEFLSKEDKNTEYSLKIKEAISELVESSGIQKVLSVPLTKAIEIIERLENVK